MSMSTPSNDRAVTAVDAELAVARARSTARRGDLDQAAQLLRKVDTPGALDLQARIHAQRDEFADADACWARLQATEPEHPGAAAGRAAIAEIDAGRRRARPVLRPGRIALLGVVLVGVVVAGLVSVSLPYAAETPVGGSTAGGRPAGSALLQAEARADELQRQLAALESVRVREADRVAAAVAVLAVRLAVPGVRVEQRPGSARVVFDEGLFTRRDQLTAGGSALLADLGGRLAGTDVKVTVVGHVVAVPGGRESGGSVVGMARALVAARELAAADGMSLTSFTLTSADQNQGPFPDPARNRTVTLVIMPNTGLPPG